MSSQKEKDKKKKKRQSLLEAELFRIMEKSLKVAMDRLWTIYSGIGNKARRKPF